MRKLSFIFVSVVFALTSAAAWAQEDARQVQIQVVDAVNLYKNNNLPAATEAFEQLYAKHPDHKDVLAWLGFLYLRSEKAGQAVPLLERAAQMRPNDLEVMNNLGNAYLATDQLDKALGRYAQMTVMKPGMFEPWYNMGNIHLRQKNWDGALKAYTRATTLNPEDAYVLNNMGVAHENLKASDAAAMAFAKASNRSKDNFTFARNAGFAYLKTREQAKGTPFLERAHALDAGDSKVTIALANAYTREGRKLDALNLYETLGQVMQNDAPFWYNLGVMRSGASNRRGAYAAYHKALELNPTDLDTLNNLGLLVYQNEDYEQAVTHFEKLAGLAPDVVTYRVNLAAARVKLGRSDLAIEDWRKILHMSPSYTTVRLNLANTLWLEKDYEGARYHYNQVLMIEKNDKKARAEAMNGMGLYHLRASKLDDAEAAFRQSIGGDATLGSAYNNLAIVLERKNKRAEAMSWLQKGLAVDGGNEEMTKNLARMKAAGTD